MELLMNKEVLENFYVNNFKKYQDIISVMSDKKDSNCVCNITQKEIADKINISQSLVSKCLIRMEKSDKCIEKINAGIYKVNHSDMRKYGVYSKFLKYTYAMLKFDDFSKFSWEEKSDVLKMSKDEVIMANGYWNEFVKLHKNIN